jgi:hypothetical protein
MGNSSNDEMPEWENHVFDATGIVPPNPDRIATIDPFGKVIAVGWAI